MPEKKTTKTLAERFEEGIREYEDLRGKLISRFRILSTICVSVLLLSFMANYLLLHLLNSTRDQVEVNLVILCSDTEQKFSSVTDRLVLKEGPETDQNYAQRLHSQLNTLASRQGLRCEQRGIRNYKKRLLAKMAEIQAKLDTLDRPAKPKTTSIFEEPSTGNTVTVAPRTLSSPEMPSTSNDTPAPKPHAPTTTAPAPLEEPPPCPTVSVLGICLR